MSDPLRLRVLTFNIHGGRPAGGRIDLPAIAEVIRTQNPDLVALQEVGPSSRVLHGATVLRRLLGREVRFSPSFGIGPASFGNAIVSREKAEQWRCLRLPSTREWRAMEPRTALDACFSPGGHRLRFLCTHLGLTPAQRRVQCAYLARLLEKEAGPVLLAGDLNALPGSPELGLLAQAGVTDCAPEGPPTFPAAEPRSRIDYLYVSRHFEVERCWVVETEASDHQPVVADLLLRE